MRIRTLILAGALLAALPAFADSAITPQGAASLDAAELATPAAPSVVDPATLFAPRGRSSWPEIEASNRRQALLNTRIEELALQRQLQQMEQEMLTGGMNHELPVLVGVTLGRSGHVAEFAVANGIQRVSNGEPLGGGWSVRSIQGRTVELVHVRDGKARRYVAVIGAAPTPAGG